MTAETSGANVGGDPRADDVATVWKFVWPLPQDRAVFDMPRGAEAKRHGVFVFEGLRQ